MNTSEKQSLTPSAWTELCSVDLKVARDGRSIWIFGALSMCVGIVPVVISPLTRHTWWVCLIGAGIAGLIALARHCEVKDLERELRR